MSAEKELISPRTLPGFRDYLPPAMLAREQLIETARRVYRSFGFVPIETPALEYLEILKGKGGEEADRQIFAFEDQGGRQVGLRFDLTVPLARFVAQHLNELGMPFKRYHIGTVWRGERPQRGRYREFLQCDFDIIGTTSIAADIETALVIYHLLEAIGLERFTIRINNRMVLNGLLERLGLGDRAAAVLRCLDKLPKIGAEGVAKELVQRTGTDAHQAEQILQLAALSGSNEAILQQLHEAVARSEAGRAGVQCMRQLLDGLAAAGVRTECFQLDVSIARGLDYYTGTVFETFLDQLPQIGSVCSGGRYDHLAQVYTRQQLPGIGASLGLDRLLAAMQELKLLQPQQTTAQVLIAYFDKQQLGRYLQLARRLRSAGLAAEVYPEPKRLGQQLRYADRRGFRVALIAGENELASGTCQLKDLQTGQQQQVAVGEDATQLIAAVTALLNAPSGGNAARNDSSNPAAGGEDDR